MVATSQMKSMLWHIIVDDVFVLGRWVMDNLVILGVIVFFYEVRMPFNGNMAFFEEIANEIVSRSNNAPTAHFHPTALGT